MLTTNITIEIITNFFFNTTKIGKKEIKYEYINEENIKLKQSFTINIVDTTAPVIWLGNSYTPPIMLTTNITIEIITNFFFI